MDAMIVAGALLVAILSAVLALWSRGRGGEALHARIDQLEAVLKESMGAASDTQIARMGESFEKKHRELSDGLTDRLLKQERALRELTEAKLTETREAIGTLQAATAKTLGEQQVRLTESMAEGNRKANQSLQETMKLATDTLNQRFTELQKTTDGKLGEISGKVEERLSEGFKSTQKTFADVLQRLAIIDKAQKEISELSAEVVSLQDILSDKQARGVFGEVQLNQLVTGTMPTGAYALQHDLGNGKRADCVLFLPDPTGTVAIDAKFPLENFRRMFDRDISEQEQKVAMRNFKQDVKNHINTIAEKYIVPGVTTDGAMMFLPAEAVFAEIHAHHPDLVELAQAKRVWISSPTTMMAILTTARAVLKDEKTREQVHIIQEHLGRLSQDFDRFQNRMDKLADHIRQAHEDTKLVHTSARKITSRFEKIEKVQLDEPEETKSLEAGAADSGFVQ